MKLDLLTFAANNINISYDDVPPINPKDSDQWWEPSAAAPQPWTFFEGKWYSAIFTLNGSISSTAFTTTTGQQINDTFPLSHEFENYNVFLRLVTFDVSLLSAGHTSTNHWKFIVNYYAASNIGEFGQAAIGVVATTFTTATMQNTGIFRRIHRQNQPLTNASQPQLSCRGFNIVGSKIGNPSGCHCGLAFSLRLIRK